MKLFIAWLLLAVAVVFDAESQITVPQRDFVKEREAMINETNFGISYHQAVFNQSHLGIIPMCSCLSTSAMDLVTCASKQDTIQCTMTKLGAWNSTAFANGTKIISLDAIQKSIIAGSSLTADQKKSANESFYNCTSSDPIFNDKLNGLVTTLSPLDRAKIRFMNRFSSTTTKASTTKNSSNGRRKKRQTAKSVTTTAKSATTTAKSATTTAKSATPTAKSATTTAKSATTTAKSATTTTTAKPTDARMTSKPKTSPEKSTDARTTSKPKTANNSTKDSKTDQKKNITKPDDSQQRLGNATRVFVVMQQAYKALSCALDAVINNDCNRYSATTQYSSAGPNKAG